MLPFGLVVALAAADRARRREASPLSWGVLTAVVCAFGAILGGLIVVVPIGVGMVFAAAKLGKTTSECPNYGKLRRSPCWPVHIAARVLARSSVRVPDLYTRGAG
jgi:hypothetical protein